MTKRTARNGRNTVPPETRAPIALRKNTVREVHRISSREAAMLAETVYVAKTADKRQGVFAKEELPGGTYVGSMAGPVYSFSKWKGMKTGEQITGKYGMELPGGMMVDIEMPMNAPGSPRFHAEHEPAVAHMINEPSIMQTTSAVWVTNNATGGPVEPRIDAYTYRTVAKGKEITVHYGDSYQGIRETEGYDAPREGQPQAYHIDLDARGNARWRQPGSWETNT